MKVKSLNDLPATKNYLTRIGAETRSIRTAVVRENFGNYWKDIAVIRFDKKGEVACSALEYNPTDIEKSEIAKEFENAEWPYIKPLSRIINPPPQMAKAEPHNIFEFRDESDKIVMVQVRQQTAHGKAYLPFTYWDDDQWRMCEPDGPLPLYNGHLLKDAHTVFIHEGAKAAAAVQRLVEGISAEDRKALSDHPWGQEFLGAVHLGWIGGALSPYRTDWSVLQKMGVKTAYIVADNDEPGRAAVPHISRHLRMPTFTVQFTDEFPSGFDLADQFPENLFGMLEGVRYYTGPQFRDCLHPATWATDLIPNARGKPTPVLRDSFREMWAYVEEADVFVCTKMPEILRAESIVNKMLAPFSHVNETSKLIVKAYRGRSTRICYRPNHPGLLVTFRGSSAINLHVPTTIKSQVGDPKPWLDFVDYMFVHPQERREVLRWCATLIARPDVRMSYGLLLVSESQGIGKTTLGSHILVPLVGVQNAGFPREEDITSSFNDWLANKRLVVVNEIYSGSSWRAYNLLKSAVTDRDISVNQKYMRPYTIENWCHILACSNSMRALKMENDDRRWFYPELTELPWRHQKFIEFRGWLESGGLGIIKHWAEEFGDYVRPSDRAPMTERKRELIDGSRSEAQKEAAALAELLKDLERPAALLIKDVVHWARQHIQGRVFDTDYEIRKVMVEAGLRCWTKRIKIAGHLQSVLCNQQLWDRLSRLEDEAQWSAILRDHIMRPHELMEPAM